MKKLTAFLLALLLGGMGMTAYADEVTISTTVPERHTVTVAAEGGEIAVNGHACGASVQVERHKKQSYWILPADGRTLKALYYNGEDVTGQVRGGVFTAPALTADAALKAVFQAAAPARTDEKYDIGGTVTDEEEKPVPGARVEIGGKTGTTDEDGDFLIGDVPPGVWPIVVTDPEGKIIGSGEITIEEPGKGDLTVETDENGNPVVTPGRNTEKISVALEIGADGVISLTGVKDATRSQSDDSEDPDKSSGSGSLQSGGGISAKESPDTGDDTAIGLWLGAMAVSAVLAACCLALYRKKKA